MGASAVAELLIARQADLNARNNHGQTPLMWCARHGHAEIAEKLVKAGADSSLRCKSKFNARDYARFLNHHGVIKVLPDPWWMRILPAPVLATVAAASTK